MSTTTLSEISPLATFFNQFHSLPPEAIETISNSAFTVNIPKGRFLSKPGMPQRICLLQKGVMRAYVKMEGKEITTWISEENEMVGSVQGIHAGTQSHEYIQALEDCTCTGIPSELVQFLFSTFPETNIVGRKILEHCYRNAEERAFISRIGSAEKRYTRFIEKRPNLAARISLKYVASYLNMTLETLSRIRHTLRSNAQL